MATRELSQLSLHYLNADKSVRDGGKEPTTLLDGSTSDVTGPAGDAHATPYQLPLLVHGDAAVSQPVAFVQLLEPPVPVNRSTRAPRSGSPHPPDMAVVLVRQLPDHTLDDTGNTADSAAGTMPVSWLYATEKVVFLPTQPRQRRRRFQAPSQTAQPHMQR